MKKKIVILCIAFIYILIGVSICYYSASLKIRDDKSEIRDDKKEYRFLLMMSSFKRPFLVTGQAHRFMVGTYQNFDISLSLKGVDDFSAAWTREELKDYISHKRLFFRVDENKNQLSNLLDTVRDIDLSRYDYFCKIDDDDWYHPDYLVSVNESLNEEKDVFYAFERNTTCVSR